MTNGLNKIEKHPGRKEQLLNDKIAAMNDGSKNKKNEGNSKNNLEMQPDSEAVYNRKTSETHTNCRKTKQNKESLQLLVKNCSLISLDA